MLNNELTSSWGRKKKKIISFPFIVVISYFIVEYGRPHDWLPPLRAAHPGILIFGLAILTMLVVRPTFNKSFFYILLFFLVMVIGVPFATNRFYAYSTTFGFATLIFGAILPIISYVNTYEKLRILIWLWILIHISLAIYGVLNNGVGVGYFIQDENDLCLAINIAIPYAIYMFMSVDSRKKKLILIVAIIMFLATVVSTLSRGGFIGLLAIGGMFWLKLPRKMAATIILIISVLVMWWATPSSYWEEMQTIESSTNKDDTGHERLYLWGVAWKMFLDNPIIGVGPSNFPYNNEFYESQEEKRMGRHIWGKASHSLYFTLLPELGLIGTFIFFYLVLLGIKERKTLRNKYQEIIQNNNVNEDDKNKLKFIRDMSIAIDIALVTFLVSGAFLTVLYYPHFWVLIAFSVITKSNFDKIVEKITAKDCDPLAAM